jgi:hypothetical protein
MYHLSLGTCQRCKVVLHDFEEECKEQKRLSIDCRFGVSHGYSLGTDSFVTKRGMSSVISAASEKKALMFRHFCAVGIDHQRRMAFEIGGNENAKSGAVQVLDALHRFGEK